MTTAIMKPPAIMPHGAHKLVEKESIDQLAGAWA